MSRAVSAPPTGGRIDRGTTVRLHLRRPDVHRVRRGHARLGAAGQRRPPRSRRSIKLGRPRGISRPGPRSRAALVQIEAPFPEPMLLATTVELYDGLVARASPARAGWPMIADSGPLRRHARARRRARGRRRTGRAGGRADRRPRRRPGGARRRAAEAGGSLLGGTERIDGAAAIDWVEPRSPSWPTSPRCCTCTHHGVRPLRRRLRAGPRAPHRPPRQRRPGTLSRQRVWRIRARHVVLATGAHERPIVFADNDRPGIMLARRRPDVPAPLRRAASGARAVVFTTNDSAYAAAVDLADAGVRIAAVVDARPRSAGLRRECAATRHRGAAGHVVVGTRGTERVSRACRRSTAESARRRGSRATCCWSAAAGTRPCTCSARPAAAALRRRARRASCPASSCRRSSVAGRGHGVLDLAGCLREGRGPAGGGAGRARGCAADVGPAPERAPATTPSPRVWCSGACPAATATRPVRRPAARRHGRRRRPRRRRRDALGRAHQALHHRRAPRTTRARPPGVLATGIAAELLGVPIGDARHDHLPAAVHAGLVRRAGRAATAARCYDPVRVTAAARLARRAGRACSRTSGSGSGRGTTRATARTWTPPCCASARAARSGVGMLDGSTLGKIDVQGPDAGEFLRPASTPT